jgi:hypothetical protein
MPPFEDLPSLNTWLEARCVGAGVNSSTGGLRSSVAEVHALERTSLMPVGLAFDDVGGLQNGS